MSNPYGDWATETPGSDPTPRNHGHGFDQNDQTQTSTPQQNDFGNQGKSGSSNSNDSYGGGGSGGNSYGGGGNSYGGGGSGGNSYGGGRPPLDIPIPGRYVPISVHLGKDVPSDKVELLHMMLKSMQDEKFVVRVAVNNDACSIVRDYLSSHTSGEPMKVEYVRPWKKFEVDSYANGDDGWYPTIPVTKSCEVLIPALGNKDDKARSFKVLEGALIMGRAAKQTARVLITYSPDGLTSHTRAGKDSAFMQNIVRFSQMFGVTVINLGASDARQRYGTFLNQFNTETKSHGQ